MGFFRQNMAKNPQKSYFLCENCVKIIASQKELCYTICEQMKIARVLRARLCRFGSVASCGFVGGKTLRRKR